MRVKKPSARDFALVDSLVNSQDDFYLCYALDHKATEAEVHHSVGKCPPLERIRAAWARIVAAQEPKPKKEKP